MYDSKLDVFNFNDNRKRIYFFKEPLKYLTQKFLFNTDEQIENNIDDFLKKNVMHVDFIHMNEIQEKFFNSSFFLKMRKKIVILWSMYLIVVSMMAWVIGISYGPIENNYYEPYSFHFIIWFFIMLFMFSQKNRALNQEINKCRKNLQEKLMNLFMIKRDLIEIKIARTIFSFNEELMQKLIHLHFKFNIENKQIVVLEQIILIENIFHEKLIFLEYQKIQYNLNKKTYHMKHEYEMKNFMKQNKIPQMVFQLFEKIN